MRKKCKFQAIFQSQAGDGAFAPNVGLHVGYAKRLGRVFQHVTLYLQVT